MPNFLDNLIMDVKISHEKLKRRSVLIPHLTLESEAKIKWFYPHRKHFFQKTRPCHITRNSGPMPSFALLIQNAKYLAYVKHTFLEILFLSFGNWCREQGPCRDKPPLSVRTGLHLKVSRANWVRDQAREGKRIEKFWEVMGHNGSEERRLSTDIMQHTLKKRGLKLILHNWFFSLPCVQQCSPWFPDHGTLNLETWDRVGKDIQVWDHKKC